MTTINKATDKGDPGNIKPIQEPQPAAAKIEIQPRDPRVQLNDTNTLKK